MRKSATKPKAVVKPAVVKESAMKPTAPVKPRRSSSSIRLIDAALEERGEFIILRGVLDPECLDHLITPDYQRGILSRSKINDLARAIESSKVPDIELAVRGGQFTEDEEGFSIHSSTYIMDGLQRVTAARQVLSKGFQPYLGATAYFNTDVAWERERFKILNADRVRVSPNVLLRNLRGQNEAVKLFFELTNQDKEFVLYDRVSWQQNQKRTELMSILTLMKTVRSLHTHIAGFSNDWERIAAGLLRLMQQTGKPTLTANIKNFFGMLDECWSVRNVVYTERQPHLKGAFLFSLAEVLSRHLDFWQGHRLVVDKKLAKKIASFPLQDPAVQNLASSSGQSRNILLQMLIDHINSGKRTQRLKPRQNIPADEVVKEVAA